MTPLMVHFRKRLSKNSINEISELIAESETGEKSKHDKNDDNDDDFHKLASTGSSNSETRTSSKQRKENFRELFLDATCALANIYYSTDLRLLNEAWETLEENIEVIHKLHRDS